MHTATTLQIDTQIGNIDRVICRHIDSLVTSPRGIVSQDILSQLRNLVEHIMLKFYAKGSDIENSYPNICRAIDYVKSRGNLVILRKFHDYLQIVSSHYTLDEENSERLMLKYYEYLYKIKILVKDKFSIDILSNLDRFPLNEDTNLYEYYKEIASRVDKYHKQPITKLDKYYIQKIKPFFVNQCIFYEVTFTPANDYASKFNRIIAFTNLDINDYYAVRLALVSDSIEILGKSMPIVIIVGWEIAIRDCEFKNFTQLIRGMPISTGRAEQWGISQLLTSTGLNLTDLLYFNDDEFSLVKQQATLRAKTVVFFNDLERCREINDERGMGSNVLRYLLYHMNNVVLKKQYDNIDNNRLSGLYLKNGCIPFEKMPFNTSLVAHNPKLVDIFSCIDAEERQHEILARLVRNNAEIKGNLFTPVMEINGFNEIEKLVEDYNNKLWTGHRDNSKLMIKNGYIYINGYVNNTYYIINELSNLTKQGVQNYSNSVNAWLNSANHGVDCEEKRKALTQLFENSRVALVYGSAGTGKSTFINHVAHLFSGRTKLFLAQTNPAVDNLKRRVTASSCVFSTIASFLLNQNIGTEYDLLVIDECSTVSNNDMRQILIKADFSILVLVGDTYQISSIRFGNWFSMARAFIPESSVFELTKPYRSKNEALLTLWDRVRKMDDDILELITKQGYSITLDASIFAPAEADEIILCLNYDGLYGINNVNRLLQEGNPSDSVLWGIQMYKVNDPILFNESNRFAPLIYNNMKGRILGIEILNSGEIDECIQFDIEIDKVLNGVDVFGQDFKLLENSDAGNSVIRFCVNKLTSSDEDDDGTSKAIVPFQIAYAVSIHKAQGLEYDSVKIVITDEIDELITHNIFYTAITRARRKLRIFWSPEVERNVLERIKPRNINKDVHLLRTIVLGMA